MTFPVGETLDGRYLVRREIAYGTHSTVYEAQHVRTCRSVALKLHPVTVQQQSVERDVLFAEARLLGEMHHPGIVEVLDAGEARARTSVGVRVVPYLVLEMVEGRSLAGVLASRGALPLAESVRVVLALADTLASVHSSAVVHGDVAPANVFLPVPRTHAHQQRAAWPGVQDIAAKLLGFGAAVRSIILSSNAGEDIAPGSAAFLPPERLRGDGIEATCDVYSLGAVLYACLTGVAPYDAKGVELIRCNHPPALVPPTERRAEVPSALADVAVKALSLDPAARYAEAAEMGRAILAAVKEGRQPSSRRSVELPPAPPSQPESEAKPDNRRFDRASYLTPVRILRDGGENVDGQCEDLSEGGMLVIAADVLADGERVNIRFALPVSGKIVTTQAIARWLRGAREGRGAMGLEFVELTPEVRRGIVGYVRHFRGARRGDG